MKTAFILIACLLLSAFTASARTISWRSAIGDDLIDASGNDLDETFTFELGAFLTGFTPTASNLNDWQANWRAFGQATFEPIDGNGWEPSVMYLTKDTTLLTGQLSSESPPLPSYAFTTGTQAWLWVYDSQVVDTSSEWALVRGTTWNFPTADAFNFNALLWELNSADQRIWGGSNDLRGNGGFIAEPADFTLQTAVVPEPSSALLLVSALLLRLRRRRR
jgi:hypothetical protein